MKLSFKKHLSARRSSIPTMFGIAMGCVASWVVRVAHADVSDRSASDEEWPQSPGTGAAQTRFDEGVELARASNYEAATKAFQASFEQSPSRSALFAWAQSERLSGHCENAIPLYDRFIKNAPTEEQQQAAQIALRRCADLPLTTVPTPPVPSTPPSLAQGTIEAIHVDKATPVGAVWPMAATGGALVVAGAVMLFVSQIENNSAEKADSYQNFRDTRDRSRTEQIIGWSSTGLGIATLGSAAWIAWRPRGETQVGTPSLALVSATAGPGSMFATFKGRF